MKESQKDMHPHSEAKIQLLQKYLEAYFSVLANSAVFTGIHAYDLCCGEGVYPNGKAGSPVTIAKQMRTASEAFGNSCPQLSLSFNDKEKAKVDSTVAALGAEGIIDQPGLRLIPTCKNYLEVLPVVQRKIARLGSGEKAFIFVDPYGYKDVRPNQIKSLLKGGKSEVLLFQPTQFLFRFSNKGTPEALSDFSAELDQGKPWPTGLDIWGYIDHLRNLFWEYMGNEFFVDTFTIKKDDNTVFCLFFFTSHIRGFEKMIDAKWKLNETSGRGWHHSQAHAGLELFNSPQTNLLEQVLRSELGSRGTLTNAELYELTLRAGYRATHCVDVLKALQKTGEISVTAESGEKVRKGSFYINYAAYNTTPTKINITQT